MDSWPTTFGDQNRLPPARTRVLIGAYSYGLLLMALPGLVRGLRARSAAAWTLLLVFCALALAHAMTFLNQRFAYVKLPLLAMGLAITLAGLEERSIVVERAGVRLRIAALVALALLVCAASATALLLAR
jgi:lysylphosphatidylglycerol synthetase-like protein (DUF2156 family)